MHSVQQTIILKHTVTATLCDRCGRVFTVGEFVLTGVDAEGKQYKFVENEQPAFCPYCGQRIEDDISES